MKRVHFLATFVFLAFSASFAFASDPSPLQDFCVAINDIKDGGMLCYYLKFLTNFSVELSATLLSFDLHEELDANINSFMQCS